MAKFPLILPSDPSFYELPPPPGPGSGRSFESMLQETVEDGDGEVRTDGDEEGDPGPADRPVLPGACDSHVHVFADEAKFAYRDGSDYRPDPAPAESYARLRRRLGLDRVVVVQSSAYGFDHACLLDALQRLDGGPDGQTGRARGIAAVGPAVSEGELRDLAAAGCVATRFQMRDPWRLIDWTETDRLAGRVHDTVGWDVELQMDGKFLHEVEQRLLSWPGRVILDHVGCFLGRVGDREPGLRALLRLIDADKVWVKLSGPEESSNERQSRAPGAEPPRYRDVERIARQLIRFAPERLVWGSNWPHPAAGANAPDDRWLFDLLGEWTEDEGLRRRILVDNAAALFGFKSLAVPATGAGPGSG
ncbi:amidohydrolase family protein [Thalassobaculum sp.]|uniref:amidohydrolase family protein n=1 Tax=Thalassobaculum sp. TaxID=2022740 RepID=UPI0032EF9C2A